MIGADRSCRLMNLRSSGKLHERARIRQVEPFPLVLLQNFAHRITHDRRRRQHPRPDNGPPRLAFLRSRRLALLRDRFRPPQLEQPAADHAVDGARAEFPTEREVRERVQCAGAEVLHHFEQVGRAEFGARGFTERGRRRVRRGVPQGGVDCESLGRRVLVARDGRGRVDQVQVQEGVRLQEMRRLRSCRGGAGSNSDFSLA